MVFLRSMTNIQKDYFVRTLRKEIDSLEHLLKTLENSSESDMEYIEESIRLAQVQFKGLGRFLQDK